MNDLARHILEEFASFGARTDEFALSRRVSLTGVGLGPGFDLESPEEMAREVARLEREHAQRAAVANMREARRAERSGRAHVRTRPEATGVVLCLDCGAPVPQTGIGPVARYCNERCYFHRRGVERRMRKAAQRPPCPGCGGQVVRVGTAGRVPVYCTERCQRIAKWRRWDTKKRERNAA